MSPETLLHASANVYVGTAGIGWFLAELTQFDSDPELTRTARGALIHATEAATTYSNQAWGFYDGRVGVGYVLARASSLFSDPLFLAHAKTLLQPLLDTFEVPTSLDSISGTAGAIPALLALAAQIDDRRLALSAIRLADHLIEAAIWEPVGWSWNAGDWPRRRNLTGLAHGASGAGLALLETYIATGNERYLYAAEQAFRYERNFLERKRLAWEDFRNPALREWLTRYSATGAEPPSDPPIDSITRFRQAPCYWCHGAAGIGLARLRAFELLGHECYRDESDIAVKATLSAARAQVPSFSLCHGLGGNAETLLLAARVLNAPQLIETAEAWGWSGWKTYEGAGRPWPCSEGGAIDASLMLGEAGIGFFYLRLFDLDIPSPLLRTVSSEVATRLGLKAISSERGYQPLQEQYARHYFNNILKVIETQHHTVRELISAPASYLGRSDSEVTSTYSSILSYIAAQPINLQSLLEDAFLPEKTAFELAIQIESYTDDIIDQERQKMPATDFDNPSGYYVRSNRARLATVRWDWDTWLSAEAKISALPPPAITHLLFIRTCRDIKIQRVNGLVAVMLKVLDDPLTQFELQCKISEIAFGQGRHDNLKIHALIRAQLAQLVSAGIIKCVFPSSHLGR